MPNLPINLRRVAVVIGLFIMVFVILGFNARIEEYHRQKDLVVTARAQATQIMQTQIVLQTQVAYADSTAAVDQWARTDGHYIKDGDLPVVPLGNSKGQSAELATSTPTTQPMPNWQVWWNLFFGEQ